MTVTIGILDSGLGNLVAADSAAFRLDDEGRVVRKSASDTGNKHGAQLAQIFASTDADIKLLDAQVFSERGASSPVVVAAGLDWLVDQGAQAINMSFGLTADRFALKQACDRALKAGVVLVAASPARGDPVYPAAYTQVVSVTGDARCSPGELSNLATETVQFGACVHPPGGRPGTPNASGASIAVAHMTGTIAQYLAKHTNETLKALLAHLTSLCRYRGAEMRTS